MIGFDEACGLVEGAARNLGTEHVSLGHAAGRICAAPVVAAHAAPAVAMSAMDGYAVRDADLSATRRPLRVVGEVFAGQAGFAGRTETGKLRPHLHRCAAPQGG